MQILQKRFSKLFEKSKSFGFAHYLYLRCDNCETTTNFWSVQGKFSGRKIPVGNFTVRERFDTSYQAVLGASLAGIGKMDLDYISCSLGLGKSLSYPCFTDINRDLLVVVEHIANKSMQKAIDQLRDLNGLMPDEKVHITGSYDGAYQRRSSKNSGGFSRYCYSSLIDMQTGKVVAYEVACNSCPRCTELRHQFGFCQPLNIVRNLNSI